MIGYRNHEYDEWLAREEAEALMLLKELQGDPYYLLSDKEKQFLDALVEKLSQELKSSKKTEAEIIKLTGKGLFSRIK